MTEQRNREMEEEGWRPRLEADVTDVWGIQTIWLELEEKTDIKQMKKHNTCSKWP